MSEYQKIKAVRYKLTKEDLEHFEVANGYELRDKFETFLDSYPRKNNIYFVSTCAENPNFLDFILVSEEGEGDYGRTRRLSDNERGKYYSILANQFEEMDKSIGRIHRWLPDPRNFRVVEFCWYNCSEAPNYFDEEGDPFYDEV